MTTMHAAWVKAAEFGRLAKLEHDPSKRMTFRYMRDLWIGLAKQVAALGKGTALEREFLRLRDMEELMHEGASFRLN